MKRLSVGFLAAVGGCFWALGCDATVPVAPAPAPVFGVRLITPASGSEHGNTAVTIFGSGLTPGTTVAVGGTLTNVASTPCPFYFGIDAPDCIIVKTPAHAPGVVDVIVTSPDGQQPRRLSYTYTDFPAPTISKVSPSLGSADGGTALTLTGTFPTSPIFVTFDGVKTYGSRESPTTVRVTSPPHRPGPVDVVVIDADGGSATLSAGYTYVPFEQFDFNGEWTALAYGDDESDVGTEIHFTIRNNILTSVSWLASPSCKTPGTFVISAPPGIGKGQFSFGEGSGQAISGHMLSSSTAQGSITFPCPATDWWGQKSE